LRGGATHGIIQVLVRYSVSPDCTRFGREPPTGGIHEEEAMKKAAVVLALLVVVMMMVPAAFAQETGAKPANPHAGSMAIAAGFGMALAAFGCALGQSRVASSACEGMARNPGAAGSIRAAMILGLVFIETLLLFTLLIVFIKI
jgi:F-type H+-transporting ATPase subunit c